MERKLKKIAEMLDLDYVDLMGKNRFLRSTMVRQMCWEVMKKDLFYSLQEIANVFYRDHSTISHGIKQSEIHREREKGFQEIFDNVRWVLIENG